MAKSASLDLTGFTAAQRAALTPILKSQNLQAARQRQLEAQHKEAVAKSAALQDKLDRKEFVAKAAEFPHLGTPEVLGEQMHKLHKSDPEGFETWMEVLKSANMASDNSPLFEERGSKLSKSAGAADAIEAAVASIVQKSAGMTKEQATRQFLGTQEGRKLYSQDRREAEIRKKSV
ncbi:MAG: hypothetical protein EOO40_00145 [Deltaproteobacteria bacterium]|nr:MAG: hypothetical protein EOO40_00145 [Deltaproteobacteria bacterium]